MVSEAGIKCSKYRWLSQILQNIVKMSRGVGLCVTGAQRSPAAVTEAEVERSASSLTRCRLVTKRGLFFQQLPTERARVDEPPVTALSRRSVLHLPFEVSISQAVATGKTSLKRFKNLCTCQLLVTS